MIELGIKPKPKVNFKSRIGLDIGSHTIKMVEIGWPQQKPKLTAMGTKEISGLGKEDISESIKILAGELKVSGNQVAISISGPSVIVRFISMPKMNDADFRSAVKFEAEKFVPFNMADCIMDFQAQRIEGSENKVGVVLVAAKREYIRAKMELVEHAGFTTSLIDVDSFAFTNTFLQNFPDLKPDRTVALLNLGDSYTNLSILKGQVLAFTRDIAIGGKDITSAISKVLGVDTGVAETLKVAPKEKTMEMQNASKPALDNLLDDVKLSFSYHENQSGRSIDEIYVLGGGGALLGLEDAFQEAFGSKPSRWNPFQFLDTASSGIDTDTMNRMKDSFAVAVGLALR